MTVLVDFPSATIAATGLFAAALSTKFGRGFWSLAHAVVLPIGVCGTVVGAFPILVHLDDPTQMHSALAVAFLGHFYAAILKLGLSIYAPNGSERVDEAPGARGWAAAALIAVLFVSATLYHNSLGSFFDVYAALLCALGVAATVGLTKASTRTNAYERVVHTLPWVGMLIMYGSGIGILVVLDDPTKIGPIIAIGLLGSLYALLGSVLLQLLRPHQVGPHPPLSQWLVWACSSVGVAGFMGLIVISITGVGPGS